MSFLRIFFGSFCSPVQYRSMRQHQKGFGLAYSALLIAFSTLAVGIWAAWMVHRALFVGHNGHEPLFEDAVHQIARQLPIMTLDKTHLVTQYPQATTVTLAFKDGKLPGLYKLLTIDTTGATTLENMKTPFLINNREVIFYNERTQETKIHALSEYTTNIHGPLVINRTLAESSAESFIRSVHANLPIVYTFFILVFGLFGGVIYYVMRIMMIFSLGLAGQLIASIFLRQPVPYEACVRLAVMSYTPVAVLSIIAFMLSLTPVNTLILIVCGVIMLTAALMISRDEPLAEPA